MRQQHLLSINFHIIYKLLVTTHFAYHHKTPIPREINKAIFKSESTENYFLKFLKYSYTKRTFEYIINKIATYRYI